jgi:predicted enzyme related to lactoylglutathione lyase
METLQMNGYSMAFFPADKGIGGAVVAGEGCVPGQAGPLVYLNGGKDLNAVLGKVNEAGGRVVMSKTLINKESGYFAIFIDTEGNRLALHSKN